MASDSRQSLQYGAIAGWIGASMLGTAIAGLTYLQYEFMRGLGWHPLAAPTHDWPSGLALGPYGVVMTVAFVTSGLAMLWFARGLRAALTPHGSRCALFLSASGIALVLLASPTDPTNTTITPTLFGRLHDTAFVLLGLTFFPGLVALLWATRQQESWLWLVVPTLLIAALVVPAFVLKGYWFYVFLIAVLGWVVAVATQLWRLARYAA